MTPEQRAQWGADLLRAKAKEGFYGNIKVFYENGKITHTETTERQKAPVDMQKPQG